MLRNRIGPRAEGGADRGCEWVRSNPNIAHVAFKVRTLWTPLCELLLGITTLKMPHSTLF